MAELDQLTDSDLLVKGDVKQFYIQLSEIIRKYIEGRFYIVAIEMTTMQLIYNMEQIEVDKDIVELTSEFLESCALVKFAKYIPTEQENQIAIQQAYDIVNKTKIELHEIEEEAVTEEKGAQSESIEKQPEAAISDESKDIN